MIPIPILDGIFSIGSKLIDRLIPDPAAKAAAQLELFKMQQTGDLANLAAETDLAKGQLAINVEEAKSPDVFVAGWRPFIGWTCGCAFAFHFVLGPIIVTAANMYGHPVQLPVFDFGELAPVLLGMLGLGGLRTVEKIKGVA